MALDKILVKYELVVDKFNKQVSGIQEKLKKTETEVKTSTKKQGDNFKDLGGVIKKVGAGITVAFAVGTIIKFGKELIEIQKKAHGIQKSFERLNNPASLHKLRLASKGLLTDLELMKKAVAAKNIGIPMQQLGKIMQFAALKAQETGKSVDSITESIIKGIGGKSTRTLRQFGITTDKLKNKMDGVNVSTASIGEVAKAAGEVIDEALSNAGDVTLTLNQKVEANRVMWQNLKLELSNNLLPTLNSILTVTNATVKVITTDHVPWWKKILSGGSPFHMMTMMSDIAAAEVMAARGAEDLGDALLNLWSNFAPASPPIRNIKSLRDELNELEQSLQEVAIGTQSEADLVALAYEKHKELNKALERQDEIRQSIFDKQKQSVDKLPRETPDLLPTTDPDQTLQGLDTIREATEQAQSDLTEAEREGRLIRAQERGEEVVSYMEQASNTVGLFNEFANSIAEIQLANLDKRLKRGEISQEQFDKKSKEIKQKQARREKALAIFETVIATSRAVTQALPVIPLSVLIGAIGAAQIAAIIAQPLPKFNKGVVGLDGQGTETSDSIPALLSKNESVITAKGTRQDIGLFKAANKLKLKDYINEHYVIPEMQRLNNLNKQEAEALNSFGGALFDDLGLRSDLKQLKSQSKINTRSIVKAIDRSKEHPRNNL